MFILTPMIVRAAGGWAGTVVVIALWIGTVLVLRGWSARPGWGRAHRLALVTAGVATYAWHGFLATPMTSTPIGLRVASNTIYALVAAGLLILSWRGTGRHSDHSRGLSPYLSEEVDRREQSTSLRSHDHLDR